jgi:hypothetical protein
MCCFLITREVLSIEHLILVNYPEYQLLSLIIWIVKCWFRQLEVTTTLIHEYLVILDKQNQTQLVVS